MLLSIFNNLLNMLIILLNYEYETYALFSQILFNSVELCMLSNVSKTEMQ